MWLGGILHNPLILILSGGEVPMLAQMRSATFIKAMMIIVAVAFVGLMVFEWGADFSSRGFAAVGDNVGSVNGQDISVKQFEAEVQNDLQQARTRDNQDPDVSQIISQTWERVVTQTLFGQQIEKYGIAVTDAEVDHINRTQPPSGYNNKNFSRPMVLLTPPNITSFSTIPARTAIPE